MKTTTRNRRAMLSAIGAAAAGAALSAAPARAQAAQASFTPARHKQDEWLDTLPGKHRVFVDSSSAEGGGMALAYSNNIYNASKSGYGLEDTDTAIVVCFRHLSTPFAFNNSMWAKYGKALAASAKYTDPRSTEPPTANPQRQIESLTKRGMHFAVCDLATRRVAGEVAKSVGGVQDDVYKELVANVIANGHFFPAGVIGVTRAQEYGYSLLVAG